MNWIQWENEDGKIRSVNLDNVSTIIEDADADTVSVWFVNSEPAHPTVYGGKGKILFMNAYRTHYQLFNGRDLPS